MKDWLIAIGITLIILTIAFLFGVKWFVKEAFGPTQRTVEIKVNDFGTLICDEEYNADLAAVFYDVDFSLKTADEKTLNLGHGSFSDEYWSNKIKLHKIANWTILLVNQDGYSKLLLTDTEHGTKDTTFSPLALRHDSLWKKMHDDIPSWAYDGSSKIDSTSNNSLFVSYEYRIGDSPPFQFFKETIEYYFDDLTGTLKTRQLFDRHQMNNGR